MGQSASSRDIEGRCHCGNIQFTFHLSGSGPRIAVRACGCTFCRKHGGVYTSDPAGRLAVRIVDEGRVTRYRFGTKTADFHVCSTCGVVPVVTSTIEGTRYAVVNVNCFEGVDPAELDRSESDFDGEVTESRLARRRRNWIPDVTIEAGKPARLSIRSAA